MGELIEQKSDKEVVTKELLSEYLETLGSKLTEKDATKFFEIAKAYNLNPFKREIYGIPYGSGFNIIVGYEVYLKRAEMTGQLAGWKAFTVGLGADLKACIEIKRKDWEEVFCHEVYIDEYAQDNKMWRSKPRTMLKKVVMAQGFRLAFPVEIGGIPYTADEMPDIKDITPEPIKLEQKPEAHAVVKMLTDRLKEEHVNAKEFAHFVGFKSNDIESCQHALNNIDDLLRDFKSEKEVAA
jgi:phage recombination protein Bet